MGVSASHMVSTDTAVGVTMIAGWESPDPPWGPSYTTGVGELIISQRDKSSNSLTDLYHPGMGVGTPGYRFELYRLGSPLSFAGMDGSGATFFLYCLDGVGQLLSKSVLFASKSSLLLGLFFFLVCTHWGCQLL